MEQSFNSLLEAIDFFNQHPDYIAFNLKGNTLEHPKTKLRYPINSISFVKTIKFEEESDADSVSMLHMIKTEKELQGYFIDSSGMYAVLDL